MVYFVLFAVLVVVIGVIVHTVTDDRHSKMTEKEFEAEAQRSSTMALR